MRATRFVILTVFAFGFSGCLDSSVDGDSSSGNLSSIPSDPNIPRYGAEEFVQSSKFGANSSFYQRKMQEARVESNLSLRASFFSQAVSAASNDREYYIAAKASIEAYEAMGRRSDAVQTATNANRVMPSNKSFIAYLVRNGLRPYDPSYVPDLGFSRGDLFAIAGAYVGVATATANLACGTGSCNSSSSGTPIEGSSGRNSNRSEPSSPSNEVNGYEIFQRITYRVGQDVIARGRCNSGRSFDVRYHPENGNGARDHSIYSLFGSSLDDVASKFCS